MALSAPTSREKSQATHEETRKDSQADESMRAIRD